MSNVRLKVIPEPAKGTRLLIVAANPLDKSFLFFTGNDEVDVLCGGCGQRLAAGLKSSTQLKNAVIKCPGCASFNDSGAPMS
jgi:hypothetical protein